MKQLMLCAFLVAVSQRVQAQAGVLSEHALQPLPATQHAPLRSRSLIETELRELERQRAEYGLALPIALIMGGGITTVGAVSVVLAGVFINSVCIDVGIGKGGCTPSHDGDVYIAVGAVAGGVGLVVLTVGLIVLFNRLGPRRELGERIKKLREDLRYSVGGSAISVVPTADGAALQLRF